MLKKRFIYTAVAALSLLTPALLHAKAVGVVNVKKLNVRIRPTTKYSITGVLNKGDKVTILNREGDWYMISAPANSTVWLSRPFIKGDTITKRVNLRCGPSVAFMKYTAVNAGLKVKVLDDSRQDWVQIAPPRGLAAYVSTQFITIVKPPVVKPPVVKTEPAPKPDAVKTVKKQTKPPVKPVQKVEKPAVVKKATPPLKQQSKPVAKKEEKPQSKSNPKIAKKYENMTLEELLNESRRSHKAESKTTDKDGVKFVKQTDKVVGRQGILLPLSKVTLMATHCIAIKVNNEYIPISYIYTDNSYNLNLWENRKVSVTGVQRWVKGSAIPVIEVDRIRPVWN